MFTGFQVNVRFKPAPPNSGVWFVRRDQPDPVRIPASIDHISKRQRRSSLRNGTVSIETVEHCLAAIRGLDIDNIEVELDNAELPGMDGSSRAFVESLREAGIVEQDAPREYVRVTEPVRVCEGDKELVAWPIEGDTLEIIYELDHGPGAVLPPQIHRFTLRSDTFVSDIAPARTFVFDYEAKQFQAAGLGTHLTYKDILVIGPEGPIENQFRYPDECVRHKILDLIGDLMLVGSFVCGKIYAKRTGHNLNHQMAKALLEIRDREQWKEKAGGKAHFDIQSVRRILPHRYPMLLIDRVIELDRDRRAVGIKNVSVNEPYFQGHYPRQPIMPGVLIIEAMAQLGGILVSQKLEHTGKVAVLLSLDKAKFRKPVVPGDQLIIEAETVRIRSRSGEVRCRAKTSNELVAEAQIRFMLVDADPA